MIDIYYNFCAEVMSRKQRIYENNKKPDIVVFFDNKLFEALEMDNNTIAVSKTNMS